MRRVAPFRLSLALLLLTASFSAAVHAEGVEVQRFHPAGSLQSGYLTVFQGSTDLPKHWETSLWFQYGHQPLVLETDQGSSPVIDGQLVAHSFTSVSPIHWIRLSLDLPVILYQGGDHEEAVGLTEGDLSSAGLGDIRIVPAFSFYDGRRGDEPWEQYAGVAIGVAIPVILPTGNTDRFQGESFRAEPRLTFDFATPSGWGVGVNFGALLRQESELANLNVSHMLSYGLAGRIPFSPDLLSLIVELDGNLTLGSDELSSEETPMEALAGLALELDDWVVGAGGGIGLSDGYSTPAFRTFLSVGYSPLVPPPPPEVDTDGDGYLDPVDDCPLEPEDFDGFEDEDGCPDLDHDRDGILEPVDLCPNDPEDFDGFEDEDGCPDPDNDQDGFLDPDDSCPNEPETVNGYQDDDGCPDERPIVVTPTHIEITEKIYFDYDSDVIQERSYDILDAVAATIIEHELFKTIQVEGHTDNQGTDAYNLELSQRRAAAVVEALVARGVGRDRLVPVGFGESRLVDEREIEEAHEANRRVEFLILERVEEAPEEVAPDSMPSPE